MITISNSISSNGGGLCNVYNPADEARECQGDNVEWDFCVLNVPFQIMSQEIMQTHKTKRKFKNSKAREMSKLNLAGQT